MSPVSSPLPRRPPRPLSAALRRVLRIRADALHGAPREADPHCQILAMVLRHAQLGVGHRVPFPGAFALENVAQHVRAHVGIDDDLEDHGTRAVPPREALRFPCLREVQGLGGDALDEAPS